MGLFHHARGVFLFYPIKHADDFGRRRRSPVRRFRPFVKTPRSSQRPQFGKLRPTVLPPAIQWIVQVMRNVLCFRILFVKNTTVMNSGLELICTQNFYCNRIKTWSTCPRWSVWSGSCARSDGWARRGRRGYDWWPSRSRESKCNAVISGIRYLQGL